MYHPYFRGKQFELLSVREMASVFKESDFRPIIEPVREGLSGLNRALDAIVEADGRAIVVVNPFHGDLADSGTSLSDLLKEKYLEMPGVSAGILLKPETTAAEAMKLHHDHANHSPVLIHDGFGEAKPLVDKLGKQTKNQCHVFVEKYCGKLYQKHFAGGHRVLLRDGFERKRNKDYDELEPFSDLHVTFEDEGMDGFGDFLIVGDGYSESGGPAYAIAIHLTFIDPDKDNSMWIYHFVSERQDTPKDPAGKFAEALAKMMRVLNHPKCKVHETEAVKEFKSLYRQKHFPGLGHVKKLSMNHHIETDPATDRLSEWEIFRDELMYRNRYFPEATIDLERLESLLSPLTLDNDEVATQWFRARIQAGDAVYSAAEMGAPPKRSASHGRANPAGIPYLYLGSSPEVAISEVRPHTGERACVADFTTPADLKLVDLRNPRAMVSPFLLEDAADIGRMRNDLPFLERLGYELTRPVLPLSAAIDYTPSQYLCEFIKHCGYKGVIYRSSVRDDGMNLALFDPRLAQCSEVAQYHVVRVDVAIAEGN